MGKNVAAPTVFDGRPQVPFPAYAVFETVEKDHDDPRASLQQAANFAGRATRRLKPSTPGNSVPRSLASRSTTLVPHPSAAKREERSCPIDQ
jgi:hypothetical protein